MGETYVIKHRNGTYFESWTIGPMFGATLGDAMKFDTERDAITYMGPHYGFVLTDVVSVSSQGIR